MLIRRNNVQPFISDQRLSWRGGGLCLFSYFVGFSFVPSDANFLSTLSDLHEDTLIENEGTKRAFCRLLESFYSSFGSQSKFFLIADHGNGVMKARGRFAYGMRYLIDFSSATLLGLGAYSIFRSGFFFSNGYENPRKVKEAQEEKRAGGGKCEVEVEGNAK